MEKIEIEQYKGQTIYYNEDNDKFECDISIEDNAKSTKRQSLKDVRKEIDSFIKINLNFVPFKIMRLDYGDDIQILEITSIRSDDSFVSKGKYGSSYLKLSELQKEKFNTYDPVIKMNMDSLEEDFEKVRKKYQEDKKEITKKLKPLDLSKYKYVFTNNEEE